MKRLITCSDGTWDKPETTNTGDMVDSNVCMMYNAIAKKDTAGINQLKVYDTGVGTGYSFSDKFEGGIIGLGIDKKIKDIYTFLMLNYEKGDEIYLFGFSRGAYTARSLAGFIRNCGILKHQNIHLVDKAYELYRDRNEYTKPDSDLMVSFKTDFCVEVITPITFIGVWDTVCSLGLPVPFLKNYNTERYKFHDATLSSTVDNAFHALAVDERRKFFIPTLWEESPNIDKRPGKPQVMEQRWFPGVHCNVGGGYKARGLSDQTLKWLMDKAAGVGLCFDKQKVTEMQITPDGDGPMANSWIWPYKFWHRIWRPVSLEAKYNVVIDDSVFKRIRDDKNYRPDNIMPYVPK